MRNDRRAASAGFPPEPSPYTCVFADLLRERGVREEQLETMFIANAARVLVH